MNLSRLKSCDRKDKFWNKLLKELVQKITSVNKKVRIFLFGSFVEDRFTQASDLDIAVILPDGIDIKKYRKALFSQAPLSKDWPLDLIILSELEYETKKHVGGVCFDINESGKELYPKWNFEEIFQ